MQGVLTPGSQHPTPPGREGAITRATFYRHFAGKEALVEAYLGVEDVTIRGALAAARERTQEPAALLGLVIEGLADDVARHHTRGCPFINAAEYPEKDSPVRQRIAGHRAWFRGELEALLAAAGSPRPAEAAGELVLLRDAAMVGGYLDGWERVRPAFVAAATRAASVAA